MIMLPYFLFRLDRRFWSLSSLRCSALLCFLYVPVRVVESARFAVRPASSTGPFDNAITADAPLDTPRGARQQPRPSSTGTNENNSCSRSSCKQGGRQLQSKRSDEKVAKEVNKNIDQEIIVSDLECAICLQKLFESPEEEAVEEEDELCDASIVSSGARQEEDTPLTRQEGEQRDGSLRTTSRQAPPTGGAASSSTDPGTRQSTSTSTVADEDLDSLEPQIQEITSSDAGQTNHWVRQHNTPAEALLTPQSLPARLTGLAWPAGRGITSTRRSRNVRNPGNVNGGTSRRASLLRSMRLEHLVAGLQGRRLNRAPVSSGRPEDDSSPEAVSNASETAGSSERGGTNNGVDIRGSRSGSPNRAGEQRGGHHRCTRWRMPRRSSIGVPTTTATASTPDSGATGSTSGSLGDNGGRFFSSSSGSGFGNGERGLTVDGAASLRDSQSLENSSEEQRTSSDQDAYSPGSDGTRTTTGGQTSTTTSAALATTTMYHNPELQEERGPEGGAIGPPKNEGVHVQSTTLRRTEQHSFSDVRQMLGLQSHLVGALEIGVLDHHAPMRQPNACVGLSARLGWSQSCNLSDFIVADTSGRFVVVLPTSSDDDQVVIDATKRPGRTKGKKLFREHQSSRSQANEEHQSPSSQASAATVVEQEQDVEQGNGPRRTGSGSDTRTRAGQGQMREPSSAESEDEQSRDEDAGSRMGKGRTECPRLRRGPLSVEHLRAVPTCQHLFHKECLEGHLRHTCYEAVRSNAHRVGSEKRFVYRCPVCREKCDVGIRVVNPADLPSHFRTDPAGGSSSISSIGLGSDRSTEHRATAAQRGQAQQQRPESVASRVNFEEGVLIDDSGNDDFGQVIYEHCPCGPEISALCGYFFAPLPGYRRPNRSLSSSGRSGPGEDASDLEYVTVPCCCCCISAPREYTHLFRSASPEIRRQREEACAARLRCLSEARDSACYKCFTPVYPGYCCWFVCICPFKIWPCFDWVPDPCGPHPADVIFRNEHSPCSRSFVGWIENAAQFASSDCGKALCTPYALPAWSLYGVSVLQLAHHGVPLLYWMQLGTAGWFGCTFALCCAQQCDD
ncbi:unnamed protein product [Amoebophrya sp. A25]|nr:unnamed protein product [Amoebophrya sp. A25]|eukprot:GSA25T00024568001.1